MIYIEKIITGRWQENCYVVYCINKSALVIDPGCDADRIINFIKHRELNVIAILNTHAHYDHVGAVNDLKNELSVPFFLHFNDQRLLNHANLYLKLFLECEPISIPKVDYYFDNIKNPFKLKDFSIQFFFTPGHTEGSVCLKIEDNLFSGDTLLKGKIGRVDLPGGDEKKIKKSLKYISTLPEKVIVYPGHGESTTITNELKNNKYFIKAKQ